MKSDGPAKCRTEGCPYEATYPTLGLCQRCYDARLLETAHQPDSRVAGRTRNPDGTLASEAPEAMFEPSASARVAGAPKLCPSCGHPLGSRTDTAPVLYDESKHPIEFIQGLLFGTRRADIARRFRISEKTLEEWVETIPVMAEAASYVERVPEIVFYTTLKRGLGQQNAAGEHVGGDSQILKLLANHYAGVSEKLNAEKRAAEAGRETQDSPEAIRALLAALEKITGKEI